MGPGVTGIGGSAGGAGITVVGGTSAVVAGAAAGAGASASTEGALADGAGVATSGRVGFDPQAETANEAKIKAPRLDEDEKRIPGSPSVAQTKTNQQPRFDGRPTHSVVFAEKG